MMFKDKAMISTLLEILPAAINRKWESKVMLIRKEERILKFYLMTYQVVLVCVVVR